MIKKTDSEPNHITKNIKNSSGLGQKNVSYPYSRLLQFEVKLIINIFKFIFVSENRKFSFILKVPYLK